MPVPADRVVFTSAVVTVGSTVAASMLPTDVGGKGQLPAARLLIGTSLTFMGLSVLSDFAPRLAGPLSASIAITALTYYGIPVADNYFNKKHNVFGNPASPVGRPTTKADTLAALPPLTKTPPTQ